MAKTHKARSWFTVVGLYLGVGTFPGVTKEQVFIDWVLADDGPDAYEKTLVKRDNGSDDFHICAVFPGRLKEV